MFIRRIGVFLALASLLSLALGVSAAQAQSAPIRVEMSEFEFSPSQIRLTANQPATFSLVNTGRFPHTMRIAGPAGEIQPEGGNVASGESTTWTIRIAQAGTYTFWCPVGTHRDQGMEGTIVVAGAQAAPAQVPGALPRTGVAEQAPLAAALGATGLLLFGLGWALRRKGAGA